MAAEQVTAAELDAAMETAAPTAGKKSPPVDSAFEELMRKPLTLVNGRMEAKTDADLMLAARRLFWTKVYVKKTSEGTYAVSLQEIYLILCAGSRVGFDPLQSMENIMILDGKTAIYGDGAQSLIMASGLVEAWDEGFDGLGEGGVMTDKASAYVSITRKGIAKPFEGSFSAAEAKSAGLASRGNWSRYPKDMMRWKAFHRAARGFQDVLGGLTIAQAIDEDETAARTKRIIAELPDAPSDLTPPEPPANGKHTALFAGSGAA